MFCSWTSSWAAHSRKLSHRLSPLGLGSVPDVRSLFPWWPWQFEECWSAVSVGYLSLRICLIFSSRLDWDYTFEVGRSQKCSISITSCLGYALPKWSVSVGVDVGHWPRWLFIRFPCYPVTLPLCVAWWSLGKEPLWAGSPHVRSRQRASPLSGQRGICVNGVEFCMRFCVFSLKFTIKLQNSLGRKADCFMIGYIARCNEEKKP